MALCGCVRIPFVHKYRDKARPPEAVQQFSDEAQALRREPDAPTLLVVTRAMSVAIESLPDVADAGQLAQKVRAQADAMQREPAETDLLARASLDAALEAVRRTKATVSKGDKDQAVEGARRAIEKIRPGQRAAVDLAYRQVARAMVVVTGGRAGAAVGSELSQLVARFAVDEPDDARRTGAEAIAALGDTMHGRIGDELGKRADRLAKAPPLEYAAQLKDALSLAVGALDRAAAPPAARRLIDEAEVAVDAIRPDRPLELQRPAVQEALRLVTDAITVSVSRP